MKKHIQYKFILALALTLVLSACKILKPYEKPEVNSKVQQELYREGATTDSMTLATVPWQELFSDVKLQALINEGLANSYDLKLALERVVQSQAVFRQSKQAWLPSLFVDPTVTLNHQSKAALNFPSTVNINLRTTTVQLPVGASWELDVWGKLKSAKRSALASFLQAESSARAVKTQLIASIASTYYQLLALDKQLEITQQTIAMREKNVEAVSAMKDANLVNGTSLAQNEANLYAAKVTIPDIQQAIRETENALCLLIGRVPSGIDRGNIEAQVMYTELKIGLPMQLLANRPDVEAAEMQFRSAFEKTNVARASFYPTISLTGRSGLSALTTNSLFANAFFFSLVGDMMQPIYNRGVNKMNLRTAKSTQQQAFLNFQQTLLTAGNEVSNALYAYNTSLEREEIRLKQIEALQRTVDYTKELLTFSSNTNYTDVILAEQNLLTAQLSGVNDRLLKLTAVIQLYRALGGGWK